MNGVRRVGLTLGLAILVLAPIGAGANGGSMLAMLGFAGLYYVGNAILRPGTVRPVSAGTVVAQLLTAMAFAALLVSLGQGVRSVAQIEATIPLEGWLFVAAWGLVLSWLGWQEPKAPSSPSKRAAGRPGHLRVVDTTEDAPPAPAKSRPVQTEAVPASASARPEHPELEPEPAPAALEPEPGPPSPALAAALARLDALPEEGASETDLQSALATVSGAAPPSEVVAALAARARTERDRRVLARHTTDPWVAEKRLGHGDAASGFETVVKAADARSLTEFVTLSLALLEALPEAGADLPSVARLLEIADQIEDTHETEAELLVSLAHRLEDLAAESENGADA
ncbi:MAG: hypothetical protein AAFU80_05955 [Pseudomonadota bacterium]